MEAVAKLSEMIEDIIYFSGSLYSIFAIGLATTLFMHFW
jgi:hypothetical protein